MTEQNDKSVEKSTAEMIKGRISTLLVPEVIIRTEHITPNGFHFIPEPQEKFVEGTRVVTLRARRLFGIFDLPEAMAGTNSESQVVDASGRIVHDSRYD